MSEQLQNLDALADGVAVGSRQGLGQTEHDFHHVCQQPEDYDGSLPDEEILYDLADLFKVFSDTTRIKILFALMNKGLCVADIAETVGASQSAVSHQLRTLKSSRLVKFQRDGKNVIYSLSDDHVHTMLAQGMSHICE